MAHRAWTRRHDDSFYVFDFDKSALELVAKVDAEQPRTQLNDGNCDWRGLFFAA